MSSGRAGARPERPHTTTSERREPDGKRGETVSAAARRNPDASTQEIPRGDDARRSWLRDERGPRSGLPDKHSSSVALSHEGSVLGRLGRQHRLSILVITTPPSRWQVFGLVDSRGPKLSRLLTVASQVPGENPVRLTAFVSTHRCGAVPALHRIPSCVTPNKWGSASDGRQDIVVDPVVNRRRFRNFAVASQCVRESDVSAIKSIRGSRGRPSGEANWRKLKRPGATTAPRSEASNKGTPRRYGCRARSLAGGKPDRIRTGLPFQPGTEPCLDCCCRLSLPSSS